MQFAARRGHYWLSVILGTSGLNAQTCVTVLQSPLTPEGTILLELRLYAPPGTAPAALQWTFQSPYSSIASFAVDDGPSLTSVGKTAICMGDTKTYRCLAVGANTKTIPNGIIAKLSAECVRGAPRPAIQVTNVMGVSAAGHFVPIRISTDCGKHPSLEEEADR